MEAKATDQEALLSLARNGDTEAFCDLCRAWEGRLLRQALNLCHDSELAEDLAQDTFFEAWKGLARYNGGCQFFTWLCAILLNRHRNAIRRKRPFALSFWARDQEEEETMLQGEPDSACPPDEATAQSERAASMQKCVAALPEKYREVVFLRFYVDSSLDGIAAALGCPTGTVKSRLFKALEKLRTMSEVEREWKELAGTETDL